MADMKHGRCGISFLRAVIWQVSDCELQQNVAIWVIAAVHT